MRPIGIRAASTVQLCVLLSREQGWEQRRSPKKTRFQVQDAQWLMTQTDHARQAI